MNNKRWYFIWGFSVLAVAAGVVLDTPLLTRYLLRRQLTGRLGADVREIRIAHQRFLLPGHLELDGVELQMDLHGKRFRLAAPRIEFTGLQSALGRHRRILASTEHASLSYDKGNAGDVALALTLTPEDTSGPLNAVQVSWDKVQAQQFSAFVIFTGKTLELRALKFAAFGGNISGKVMEQLSATPAYTAEFYLTGLDVEQMASLNREVSEQLNGRLDGTVSIAGDLTSLRMLDTSLAMPGGGKVSASLLAALTQYLPQSREKQRLDLLIRNGGKLAMEAFGFTMKGGDQGKFAGEIRLRSREINLELNLTHDINTDGRIDSLWAYWQRFLK